MTVMVMERHKLKTPNRQRERGGLQQMIKTKHLPSGNLKIENDH